ncbi:hypothetical protein HYW84_00890 [Candidatus Peregrinibacteria bacterium]|nr:hypothetical protein [Candidatus Peregrinibacteria bacterium]
MQEKDYHPLTETLRLYAGWLVACLFAIYAAGSYQHIRQLPFRISTLDEWIASPVILQTSLAAFLFLMLGSVHQAAGKGVWKGIGLTAIGFALLVVFRANA